MSELTKQQKLEQQEKRFNKIVWIPLILLLTIVPLIVKAVIFNLTGAVMDVQNTDIFGDVYSNYKATAIVVLSITMLLIMFFCMDKKNIKVDKNIYTYMIGAGMFIGAAFISTLLSDDTHTAWWGMPEHAEGFVMLACYILMLFYTIYAIKPQISYKYIIICLSCLILISTFIGAFQYFGYDLLTEVDFIRKIILGEQGMSQGLQIASDFNEGKVYGTMNHYNYMGSFGAMMVPFFMALTILVKQKKKRIILAFLTICSMFLLFGSTSRAGLIGLIVALLIGIIVFSKIIIKKWKVTLIAILGLTVVLIGFNGITGGSIFSRIPTLVADAVGLFGSQEEDFDYKAHIPVKAVTHENGKEKIVLQTGVLYLGNEGGLTFTDEAGNAVEFKLEENIYSTIDERFSKVRFMQEELVGVAEGEKAPTVITMLYNKISTFCFMLDDKEGVIMIDPCPIQKMEIVDAPAIGFKGKEKIGSARGYIWSRSIPMMKSTWLIGYGPDNYALKFPQNDMLAKWWAYNTPNMIIDKPHNLYLNIWINLGGLAFVGFMLMIITYIVQCFKLYAFRSSYTGEERMGVATLLAIIGYLGAGIFNDSVVAVAPIFWILLGAGIGINYLINKQRVEYQKAYEARLKAHNMQ